MSADLDETRSARVVAAAAAAHAAAGTAHVDELSKLRERLRGTEEENARLHALNCELQRQTVDLGKTFHAENRVRELELMRAHLTDLRTLIKCLGRHVDD